MMICLCFSTQTSLQKHSVLRHPVHTNLMHEKNFPTLRIGSRMVVPKEKFIEWAKRDELMKRFLDTVWAADAAALQNFSGEETSKA